MGNVLFNCNRTSKSPDVELEAVQLFPVLIYTVS